MNRSLGDALATYVPRTSEEARDLVRVREILGGSPWDRSTPLHVTGSALVVDPAGHRLLLRWHERQQAWLQVGGHADPGEDEPFAVALREAEEETGLRDLVPWPDGLRAELVHLVIVSVPAGKGEPAHEHADLRYLLATSTPDAARPEAPTAPMQWLTFDAAYVLVDEDNLRETLRRAEEHLGRQ
ncbi:MAG TPA: NUDIX domain-containing protein [Acidimicrobiales bacterium]|nr:NUDIX domain-containing protein [Acidimicrobiales bacterium]